MGSDSSVITHCIFDLHSLMTNNVQCIWVGLLAVLFYNLFLIHEQNSESPTYNIVSIFPYKSFLNAICIYWNWNPIPLLYMGPHTLQPPAILLTGMQGSLCLSYLSIAVIQGNLQKEVFNWAYSFRGLGSMVAEQRQGSRNSWDLTS